MNELIVSNGDPPNHVMDDVRSLRNKVKVEMIRVESGPDDGWTLNFEDDTSRHNFESVADLIEDTVSSEDVRRFYELDSKAGWLIQVRY